ncbi:DUF5309 domain-containing protein [Methylophilaceae bacterium]|nr:DUF5309 domain-containing protein [Methylophilaceae bacterium]
MATYQTYQSVGNREDLTDMIYDISPTETPFMSSIGKSKATATFHEWQIDNLAEATIANAAVEGADASSATLTPTTRVGNRTQISQKTIQIAGTEETVDKAGRKSEKAYQLAKASSELKRDMEKIMLANQAASAGDSSTARTLGSLQAWLNTNYVGTGTAGSLGTTARVSGTDGAFTEDMLKSAVKSAFTNGGNPTVLMVSPTQKQVVSTFAGIAEQRYAAPANKQTTIVGAADVYLSDFGTLSVVPNRFTTADDEATTGEGEQAFVLDPEYAATAFLRPFQTNELAKTGDSEKTQLLVEYTLEVKNEAAHAIVSDLSI